MADCLGCLTACRTGRAGHLSYVSKMVVERNASGPELQKESELPSTEGCCKLVHEAGGWEMGIESRKLLSSLALLPFFSVYQKQVSAVCLLEF